MGFRDGGVDILVLADGVAQMPPDDPDPDATLFYVEIFMLAELNTIEGYFTVQAALAPSSHVLVSSCRLTGGFALFNWFDPNAHSGDFVFSVGGVSKIEFFAHLPDFSNSIVVSPSIHPAILVSSPCTPRDIFHARFYDQCYRGCLLCHHSEVCHGRRWLKHDLGCWSSLRLAKDFFGRFRPVQTVLLYSRAESVCRLRHFDQRLVCAYTD